MNKRPFKHILVHAVKIPHDNLIIEGRKYDAHKHLLTEKKDSMVWEETVESYINELRKQIPETIDNYEHIFLPAVDDYYRLDWISAPNDQNKKSCIVISCKNISKKTSNNEFLKKFRQTLIKNLNNSLDYYEFLIILGTDVTLGTNCSAYWTLSSQPYPFPPPITIETQIEPIAQA